MTKNVLLFALWCSTVALAEDAAIVDLKAAKAVHAKEVARLREKLIADIDAVIKQEDARGAGINYLLKERKGFVDNGVTPILPKLLTASRAYDEGKKAADDELAKAYPNAIAAMVKAVKIAESNELKAELNRLREPPAPKGFSVPDELAGTWVVKYTNGVVRTYVIQSDGTITSETVEPKENLKGKLRGDGKTFGVEFGDGTFDRFVLTLDGRLVAEHFRTPKTEYPIDKPTVIGIGRLASRK